MSPKFVFGIPNSAKIVVLGILWGAGFPAINIIVNHLPPLGSAGVRFFVAGIILLVYGKITGAPLLPNNKNNILKIIIIGAFVFGGYQACIFLGTQYASGSVAAVVNTMTPIMTVIIAAPILGESRGFIDFCGFGFGILGVVILSQPSLGATSISSTTLGVVLVFLGTVFFAFGSVTIQLFDGGMSPEAIQGWGMLIGAALLFATGFFLGEPFPNISSFSLSTILALLYVTLVSSVGGYLLYFQLIREVGATETTLVSYIEPAAATFVSALLFSQVINISLVFGFLFVTTGFTLVIRDTLRQTVISY